MLNINHLNGMILPLVTVYYIHAVA